MPVEAAGAPARGQSPPEAMMPHTEARPCRTTKEKSVEEPRAVGREDLSSLGQLVDRVFMSGQAGGMFRCYPHLFNERNLDNLLVYVDDGRVVSHVGMIQRWACLAGCTVRVACVGSVATYEEYRGRAMATRLFAMACEKAEADGVDFMMISGGRGLYRRAGATDVGCDFTGVVGQRAATALSVDGVELAECGETDLPDCDAAYRLKSAHFVRPLDDWQWLLGSHKCMCRDVQVLAVRRSAVFHGYFIVAKTGEKGVSEILEFGGDARELAGAFKPLMAQCRADSLKLRLQTGDRRLKALCERAGVALEPVNTVGTLLLVSFPQLMGRLRPYLEARAGLRTAETLSFHQDGDSFVFGVGDQLHRVNKAAAAQVVFGHPQPEPLPGVLAQVFPVPTLCYGISYV